IAIAASESSAWASQSGRTPPTTAPTRLAAPPTTAVATTTANASTTRATPRLATPANCSGACAPSERRESKPLAASRAPLTTSSAKPAVCDFSAANLWSCQHALERLLHRRAGEHAIDHRLRLGACQRGLEHALELARDD